MATINPSQDYDIIHTLTFSSSGGTNPIRLYRGSSSPHTGTVYYRNGTSGAWTALSVSGDSTFPIGSTTMQIGHNWNKSGNDYMTPSFRGSSKLTGIDISQKAVLSGVVGNNFMHGYADSCSNLTTLSVPDTSNVTSVGDLFMYYYTYSCSKLTTLGVPDTSKLTSVGDYFMANYAIIGSRITTLAVPDTSKITSVGKSFMGAYASYCSSLTQLTLPKAGWFKTHNVNWGVPSGRNGLLRGYTPDSANTADWKALTVSGETLYTNYVMSASLVSDTLIPQASATGTIVFGGTTSRKLLTSRSATGTIVMGGDSAIQRTVNTTATGSIIMGGDTTAIRQAIRTATGSIVYGGTSTAIRQAIASTTGTIVYGGTTTRMLIARRTADGSIVMGGETRSIIVRDAEALQGKRYLYKVYDEDGSYIETWKDVISEVNWTHEINTIGSTTTIELGRNSDSVGVVTGNLQTEAGTDLLTEDDLPLLVAIESKNQIGPGSSVEYNNRVDIMAYYGAVSPLLTESGEHLTTEDDEDLLADIGAPNGRRVFTGFISEINSRYGNSETTIVQLTSYGFDLDQYPITTAYNNSVTTVPFNSYDPSNIITTGIDRFVQTAAVEQISYTHRTPLSVALSGTVVSYTFRSNTYKELLDKTLELLPANWYYRVGLGDNVVYVQERSATPHHLFYLGKHIKALDLKGSILDVKNRVLFTGGGDPALYKERTDVPAPRTRRGLSQMSDNRVTVPLSAEIIADGAIDEKNKVQYRTTVEILTEQYDIESISVGETVGFRNFGNYVDELVFQIVGSTYTGDTIQLQLETKPPTINSRLEDIRRNMTVNENQNLPTTPS